MAIARRDSHGILTRDRDRVFALVRSIPKGKVATYGQIAELAGADATHGRAVRMMLCGDRDFEKEDPPWWRVVTRGTGTWSGRHWGRQQERLDEDGVAMDREGRVSLTDHQWRR